MTSSRTRSSMDARAVLGVTQRPSHKRPRKKKTPPSKSKHSGGADRLSDLPEGVLHHVLSFLPAHESVRTCVLARNWRHRWRSAPGLLLTAIKGCRSAKKFDRFVTRMLRRCGDGAGPLGSCEFDLEGPYIDLDEHLNRWIQRALQRQFKELRVSLGEFDLDEEFQLPCAPLLSQHLTTLDLNNLGTNDTVLDFAGCPALLNLKMGYCNINANMIASQSLKHLSMSYCRFHDEVRTQIYVPSLVSLQLIEPAGRAPLLETMPLLETATITFDDRCDDKCADRTDRFDACGNEYECEGCYYNAKPVDDDDDCFLLKGLSEATKLYLEAVPDVYVFMRDLKWCPTFCKLETLVLGEWFLDAGLEALVLFLRHCPILEKLTLLLPPLEELRMKLAEPEKSYKSLEASGLLQMVKINPKIKCQEVDEMVERILKMLNDSGVSSENIFVKCD